MRISIKQLEALVTTLNQFTGSSKVYSIKNDETGKHEIQVSHFHLNGAYGGWQLVRTMNNGGGITVITNGDYETKKDLFNSIHNYINGIEFSHVS